MSAMTKRILRTIMIAATMAVVILVMGMPLMAEPITAAVAEEGAAVLEVLRAGEPFIVEAAKKHPWVVTALLVVGLLRVFLKPVFAAWHAYVKSTASERDDEIYARVERSLLTRWLFFAIDWLASIKVQKS